MIASGLHLLRGEVGEVKSFPHLTSYCKLASCTQLLCKAELGRRNNRGKKLTWKPEKWTSGRECAKVTQEQTAASFALIKNTVKPQQLEISGLQQRVFNLEPP